jgi:hypothetical protein
MDVRWHARKQCIPAAPRLSPAVPCEECRRVLRGRRVRSSLQTRRVTGGREGVVFATPPVPTGSRVVSVAQPEVFRYFCGSMRVGVAVEVYGKSTAYPPAGQSAVKGGRRGACLPGLSNRQAQPRYRTHKCREAKRKSAKLCYRFHPALTMGLENTSGIRVYAEFALGDPPHVPVAHAQRGRPLRPAAQAGRHTCFRIQIHGAMIVNFRGDNSPSAVVAWR